MPTNEERREVARKLRETSDDITDWGDSNPYWYIMKCVYGDVQIHDDNEFFYRLSSLIEQEPERTCHFDVVFPHKDGVPWYRCSACGVIIPDNSYICIEDGEEMLGTYDECPGCHAKVVSE